MPVWFLRCVYLCELCYFVTERVVKS